ncbi:MAG TPA: recombinase family protein [Mycobacteriales bacterium]|nr:recombinase family protein [Mycobacteriales bacterium]
MAHAEIAPEGTPLAAAIYCRISKDREGAGLGVDRQEADCRALAERLGWDVAAVYVDNDISAYSGKRRPQYEAMLDAVRSGRIQGVIAWHTDRLHRRAAELEAFVGLAEHHSLQVQTVTAGTVDLSSASGRMIARMLGAAAQHEIDHARERMQRAKDQALRDGRRRGGPRPFGFEWDAESKTLSLHEVEAQVIRDATQAVLAGRTLAAVARELNETGIRTATGNTWTYQRLRDVLIRPTNAGLSATGRADRGQVQIVGKGDWPAIIDPDTWQTLYKLLIDPSRLSQNGNTSRWLGSGLYVCGAEGCAGVLRPAPYGGTPKTNRPRNYLYRCTEKNHLTISANQTDDYIRRFVAEYIRTPEVAAALRPDGDALAADRSRRSVLVASREQTEADYDADLIDARRYKAKVARINDELAVIEERLTNGVQQTAAESVVNAVDPGSAFLAAPVDVQKGIVRALGLGVTIKRSAYKGAQWSSGRIHIAPVSTDG